MYGGHYFSLQNEMLPATCKYIYIYIYIIYIYLYIYNPFRVWPGNLCQMPFSADNGVLSID